MYFCPKSKLYRKQERAGGTQPFKIEVSLSGIKSSHSQTDTWIQKMESYV